MSDKKPDLARADLSIEQRLAAEEAELDRISAFDDEELARALRLRDDGQRDALSSIDELMARAEAVAGAMSPRPRAEGIRLRAIATGARPGSPRLRAPARLRPRPVRVESGLAGLRVWLAAAFLGLGAAFLVFLVLRGHSRRPTDRPTPALGGAAAAGAAGQ